MIIIAVFGALVLGGAILAALKNVRDPDSHRPLRLR
jgi:hypothetical protein